MDYKVMKRPMFRVGGPTSGGTGITSGLEEPRQNYSHGSPHYQDYLDRIPGAFDKRRTGLENQMGSIGPMALYSALAGGALEGVQDIGDLAMAFGNPAVLQSVGSGMMAKNKLQSSLDDVDLKEATTMATLLKPKGTGDNLAVYDKKVARLGQLQSIISKLDEELDNLVPGTAEYEENRKQKKLATTEIKTTISTSFQTNQDKIDYLTKIYYANNGTLPSPNWIKKELKKLNEIYDLNKAEGGRINKQMGGGFDMAQEPQAVSQEPQMAQPEQLQEDPYMVLRKRLPPEIPNEVVQLIAYNKEAFEDFANIQTQDDVDLFNQKYNVQLVVDMASA